MWFISIGLCRESNNMPINVILQLFVVWVFSRYVKAVLIMRWVFWYVRVSSGLFIERVVLVRTSMNSISFWFSAIKSISPYFE